MHAVSGATLPACDRNRQRPRSRKPGSDCSLRELGTSDMLVRRDVLLLQLLPVLAALTALAGSGSLACRDGGCIKESRTATTQNRSVGDFTAIRFDSIGI